ncbi:hypothetical protein GCM10011611_57280 [Aliidongia dinghuensis]|uniref:DUF4010 domain-containing protein n=1 Tax=Aliidongia dinghuensis TaxID=1867774 RepID=A0A8J2YYX0_9PROT|nr:DUF4010 domain-containing protein [Aliidongia dinghuensis]GGF43375.1 hypothetical protein GCM10011611_57280 [Aliidongia dinghuensis]
MASPWLNFAAALALGLLIGLERERSKGEGPTRNPAGIRTFALAALVGAVATHLGGVWFLAIVTGAVTLLATVSYIHTRDGDPGITTEIALLGTPLLGALAMSELATAAALGVVFAVVLAAKEPVHRFVTGVLTNAEVTDGLVLAIASLVIWPQLPDRYMGPWQALNPHSIWLLVILVLAIGAGGHIAGRALGSRLGLPLSGLASGFVSSTATIGSMGSRASQVPTVMAGAVAGAALSTVATYVQMALVLLATNRATFGAMVPTLVAGGGVAAIYGLVFTGRALKADNGLDLEPKRAISLKGALALAATMAVMLIVAAAMKEFLGETGIIVGAALAGFVDTHSAAISVASLVASDRLSPDDALVPILMAMTTNTVSKAAMAIGAGSRGFAVRIIPGLVLAMGATWGAMALTRLG